MKKCIFGIFLTSFLIFGGAEAATLADFPLTADENPTTVGANVGTAEFSFGSGVGSQKFASNGAYGTSMHSANFDSADFFQVRLAPNTGFKISVSSIDFSVQATGVGANNFEVRWSKNADFSGATTILSGTASGTHTIHSISGGFEILDGEVGYFRIFAWDVKTASGAGTSRFYVKNWSFSGSASDVIAPTLSNPQISTPTADTTPNFTFESDEDGNFAISTPTICSSPSGTAVSAGVAKTIVLEKSGGGNFADGVHSGCKITVSDSAGNVSNELTVPDFVVDTTPPSGTISAGFSSPTSDRAPDWNLTASDAGAGGIEMAFSCDGTNFSGWENFSSLKSDFDIFSGNFGCGSGDGSREVFVKFRDSLGNESGNFSGGSFVVDTTPPVISLVDPTDAPPIATDTISFSATDANLDASENKFGFVDAPADCDSVADTPNFGSSKILTDESRNGKYFCARAMDLAGNEAFFADSTPIEIDATNPTLTANASISSSNSFLADSPKFYAKIGDEISVNFEISEKIQTPSGTIFSRSAIFENPSGDGKNWIARIVAEAGDPAGAVNFEFEIFDLAGNDNLTVSNANLDGSIVIFDPDPPTSPTSIVDGGGAETDFFKHRKKAKFQWAGANDTGSGIWKFEVKLTNFSAGYAESATKLASENFHDFFSQKSLPASDFAFEFAILVRDRAGNASAWTTFSQKYGGLISGQVLDRSGAGVAGARGEGAADAGDFCNSHFEICSGTTDESGNFAIEVAGRRKFSVSAWHPRFFRKTERIELEDGDEERDFVLEKIENPLESQTASRVIEIRTTSGAKISVSSLSGTAEILENSTNFSITSSGRISEIFSNDPTVKIVKIGQNLWEIFGAGQISDPGTAKWTREGIGTMRAKNSTKIGVRTVAGNGKSGLRISGQKRGAGILGREMISPETSRGLAREANRGTSGAVLKYTNRNGFEIFRGYRSGRLALERFKKRFQNFVIFRGFRRNSDKTSKNLRKKYFSAKTKFQNDFSEKITVKNRQLPRRLRAGDEFRPHLDRVEIVKNKIDRFARRPRERVVENSSKIRGKNMEFVHFHRNERCFAMSRYIDAKKH